MTVDDDPVEICRLGELINGVIADLVTVGNQHTDRCHSLSSLYLPQAALASLLIWNTANLAE